MSLLKSVLKPNEARSCNESACAESKASVSYVRPQYAVTEDENAYFVDVDLPGVGKKDVSVTLHDGLLELVGQRSWTAPKGRSPIGGGHSDYAYRLRLSVGDAVGDGEISAESRNGVLRLTLPKEEEKKPRKIEIS